MFKNHLFFFSNKGKDGNWKAFDKLENTKVGGLDLSRRDLDRDLDLDAKKKSVSTVEIFVIICGFLEYFSISIEK